MEQRSQIGDNGTLQEGLQCFRRYYMAKKYVRGSAEYHNSVKIVTRQKVELSHCRRLK